jgi:hypothetical protein
VDNTLFPNFEAFAKRYCDRKIEYFGINDDGKDNEKELSLLVFELVGIRHLKRDVLKSLPTKNRKKESVQVTDEAKRYLHQLQKRKDEIKSKIDHARDLSTKTILYRDLQQIVTQMHMAMGIGKAPGVLKHILSVLKPLPGQNFVKSNAAFDINHKKRSILPSGLQQQQQTFSSLGLPPRVGDIRSHFGSSSDNLDEGIEDDIRSVEEIDEDDDNNDNDDDDKDIAEKDEEGDGVKNLPDNEDVLDIPAFFVAGANDDVSSPPSLFPKKVVEVGSNFKRIRGNISSSSSSSSSSSVAYAFNLEEKVDQHEIVEIDTDVVNLLSPPSSIPPPASQGESIKSLASPSSLITDKTADTEIVLSLSDDESLKSSSSQIGASSSSSSSSSASGSAVSAAKSTKKVSPPLVASSSSSSSSKIAYGITDVDGKTSKLVVFAHHSEVLNYLEEGLVSRGIKIVRIDGKVTPARKHKLKAAFQEDPKVQVALVSVTAAGVGISFVAASMSIFAELHWTPGVLLQAEDRIHRIGQTAPSVNITYLLGDKVPNSSDLLIWRVLEDKINAIEEIINAGKTLPAELLDDETAADDEGGGGGKKGKGGGGAGSKKRSLTESNDGQTEEQIPTDMLAALIDPDRLFFRVKSSSSSSSSAMQAAVNSHTQPSIGDFFQQSPSRSTKAASSQLPLVVKTSAPIISASTASASVPTTTSTSVVPVASVDPVAATSSSRMNAFNIPSASLQTTALSAPSEIKQAPLKAPPQLETMNDDFDEAELAACLDRIDAEIAAKANNAVNTIAVEANAVKSITAVPPSAPPPPPPPPPPEVSTTSSTYFAPPLSELDDDELNKLLDNLV